VPVVFELFLLVLDLRLLEWRGRRERLLVEAVVGDFGSLLLV
jgi:hypothetical protein